MCLYEAFEKFEKCKRRKEQTMSDFISEFELLNNKLVEQDMRIPDKFLGIKLLKSSNLPESKEQLMKATATDVGFANMKSKLKSVFCDMELQSQVKDEPEPDMIGYTNSYNHRGDYRGGYRGGYRGRGNSRGNWSGRVGDADQSRRDRTDNYGAKSTERADEEGKKPNPPSKCRFCYSIYHWFKDCPKRKNDTFFTQEKRLMNYIDMTFEAEYMYASSLSEETADSMLIDSGAPRSVCGIGWYKRYVDSLVDSDRCLVKETTSKGKFRFGDSEEFNSKFTSDLPIYVGGVKKMIHVDVVDCNIPCLLSTSAVFPSWNVKWDFNSNMLEVDGREVHLIETTSGHTCLPIRKGDKTVDTFLFTMSDDRKLKEEIHKLHRQFAHPKTDKLMKLINSSNVATKEEMKRINKVAEAVYDGCEICFKYQVTKSRPVVGLPLTTRFNECVSMDLKEVKFRGMKIILLNMIDYTTRFCVSAMLNSKRKEEVVESLFQEWIAVFGRAEKFLVDNGGEFANDEFIDMCGQFDVTIKTTAAEAPWSNGLIERNNAVIGETFLKMLEEGHKIRLALAWTINAKNSLMNVHGFSPYQLVFGQNPTLPSVCSSKLPAMSGEADVGKWVLKHLKAMHDAREQFIKAESSEKIKRALRRNVRTANDLKFVSGDQVYFRKRDSKKWWGPGTVLGQDGKQVLIKLSSFYYRAPPCRIALAKDWYGAAPEIESNPDDTHRETVEMRNRLIDVTETIEQMPALAAEDTTLQVDVPDDEETEDLATEDSEDPATEEGGDLATAEVEDLATEEGEEVEDPATEEAQNSDRTRQKIVLKIPRSRLEENVIEQLNQQNVTKEKEGDIASMDGDSDISMSSEASRHEADSDWDPNKTFYSVVSKGSTENTDSIVFMTSCDSSAITLAQSKELTKWKDNDVFEEVADRNEKKINVRWVISTKIDDKGINVVKARLVAKGFQEDSSALRKDSPTCLRESLKIVISLIVANGWVCKSLDVYAAFLQGKPIERDLYIEPPKEYKKDGFIWKAKKHIYGLVDAPRAWYETLTEFLSETGMSVCKYDKMLFYQNDENGKLRGLIVCHVDDFLYGGTNDFEREVIVKLEKRFKISSKETVQFNYLGLRIEQTHQNIAVDQNNFVKLLEVVKPSEDLVKRGVFTPDDLKELRRGIGQLMWVTSQSRPDGAFETCQASTKITIASRSEINLVNKTIKKLQQNDWKLMYPKLDLRSVYIAIFTDASWKNLPKKGSQEGFVVFLADDKKRCCPIKWVSRRCKRVAISTLAAETLAAVDGVDSAILIKEILMHCLRKDQVVKLVLYTDSKSLEEATDTSNSLAEKALTVEMAVLREHCEKGILDVKWLETKKQIADPLTKAGAPVFTLVSILASGSFESIM